MKLIKRLFRWKRNPPVTRVRICIECGMPIGEHKSWCSIFRTMGERASMARAGK